MDTLEQAKEMALKYLTARLRTRQEVKQLLQKKGYTAEITAQVLEFLERYQYLDDAVYCRSWISDRVRFHPCGRQKMAFELSKKINDRQLIAESLETYFPRELEIESAVAAAQKKIAGSSQGMGRDKLGRFLYSKGYSGSVIRAVFQEDEILALLGNSSECYDEN